jgi:hypothetical protein
MRVIEVVAVASMVLGVARPGPAIGFEQPSGDDHQVVAATLEDLVAYKGKDSPLDGIFSPDPVTLDPTPARYSLTVDQLLRQNRPNKWQELEAADRPALREAAGDLVRRIKGPIVRFTAGSAHVPLYVGRDPSKLSPFSFREAPIQASLPGYSRDRRLAILTLSIPWSIHGCSGTYVLLRDGPVWRVRVREFVCYM